ncbi:MAG: hypothetical protein ABIK43_01755 [candidate division WOR-3 bacterium]
MSRSRILLFIALFAVIAAGQRLVMFEFDAIGIDPQLAQTTATLLRDRLGDQGFLVIVPPAGTTVRSVDSAVTAASSLNAEKAVIGSITRLGAKYIISYKLIDVASATVGFGDRANIGSAEELDLATERIARAIRERRPFVQTSEIGKATAAERSQTAALSSFFLTTGYTFPAPHSIPGDPGVMLFTIDAAITYETPDVLAQGVMGLRRGKHSYHEIFFDLLVHRMFSRVDVCPYIGGGVGVRRMSIDVQTGQYTWERRDASGLAIIGSTGLILFRTQYFRIVSGVKGAVVLTEDFGTVTWGSFNFGLSSPTFGPGGSVDAPAPCIYGCLGAFFLTGLIVALTT